LERLLLRARVYLRRSQAERELNEELQHHLERQVEANLEKGLTPQEARYAAMRSFGGFDQRKEECRDAWRLNSIENFVRDVRHAARLLIKNPGFTCAVVVLLALGIGANTAVFTIVNSILLRQLPFKNADRLVWIWSTRTDRDKAFYSIPN